MRPLRAREHRSSSVLHAVQIPIAPPATTSLVQWSRSWTRDHASSPAAGYATHGTQRDVVSRSIALAAAKAMVAWPDGNDVWPLNGWKRAALFGDSYGRDRP